MSSAQSTIPLFLGLRTVIYSAPDLDAAKTWWTNALGLAPYFDEPFYVGYSIGGYEFALNPALAPADGPVTYWGVSDVDRALARLIEAGAQVRETVSEVGGGIRVATVTDPSGNAVGVIENPGFTLAPVSSDGAGPGR